tara:strand:- start:727 stop:1659 length:933 start_codon:yes stop_codon:yes gene_type:complete
MRDLFAQEITNLAKVNKELVLLSGDIGNRMFDKFKEIAPDRFINCGIAEANMISMSAGMALSGLRPVVYTITPFITTRCLEQIKIGLAYHEASVIFIGTGSGLSYSELGPTHHSLEDISILRSIPGIRILTPCDRIELKHQLRASLKLSGPTYIRIGKKGEPDILNSKSNLGIGKGNLIIEGSNVLMLCIGPIISEGLKAANDLKSKGFNVAVASMGSIIPLDNNFLKEMVNSGFNTWITLEEHGKNGGLGSTILEWLNDNNLTKKIKLQTIAVANEFIHKLGNQTYTRSKLGLDSEGIKNKILEIDISK